MVRISVALVVVGFVSAAARAALPNPLADGLRHCASESDQAKRLACFDALAASVPKVQADQFGLTSDIAQKREPVPQKEVAKKAAEEVLPGTIMRLGQGPQGELVFTLDNHQVWMQSQVDSRFSFAVGEQVHIEHGAMGSLWLAADHGRKTKVRRIS